MEQGGYDQGVTFLTPNNDKIHNVNNDKISHNQFIVVHKCVDALQEEFAQANQELSQCLNTCENVNDDLCNKLATCLQDMDTKLSELLINDMFVKKLQGNVESIQKNLNEFRDVSTSFHEKSFTSLMGNVNANNLCLNELGKDVTIVQENVWSISQKVYKMDQTVSSFEKSLELTQLKRDVISLKAKVSDFIDLCQQVGCFKPQGHGPANETKVSMLGHSYDDMIFKIDKLQKSLCNLETHMDCVETQFAAHTGKMDDDVCCNACARVVDSLSMNIRNVNTLYNALISEGLLTDKKGENLITNFQDGQQVVGPLFSTPSSGLKDKNGVISFASPVGINSRSTLMNSTKNIGDLKVDETLSETNDMGINRKVYEEQLKLIPVFNGKDTLKF